MADSYEWESEDIVVKRTERTAVYINTEGDLVIRQEDLVTRRDMVIVIPRGSVGIFTDKINDLFKQE
jgi:hypothetical protein